ncbi:MAG: alanine racemase, partial [Armatimonadetes bacterium]|nr:alanine racemase [Armatimonadota bacterium]
MKWAVGKSIYDLDTPALLVDLDVLERNIARQQAAAERAGLQMRPHIKAHKTPEIAHMQLAAGAVGVTAAKISEAEVFASAGVKDIFIANELVGPHKLARLVALAHRVPRLSVAVDSLEVAQPLSVQFSRAGLVLDVLIELDNGAGRCGVRPDQLPTLAERVANLPGLRLAGVMAYCPQAYSVQGAEKHREVAEWEGAWLAEQAACLRRAGFAVERVSGGSTPTAPHYRANCGLTEIRPGTYCLNDRNQVDLGSCLESDVAA